MVKTTLLSTTYNRAQRFCISKAVIIGDTVKHDYPKVIYTEMFIDKKNVKFQVDSGASVNVIPVKFVADKKLEPTTKTLQMWIDTTLKPMGSFRLILHNPKNKKKILVEFLN